MRTFGLIGFPLTHSFSQKHFTDKFQQEHISDAEYRNFPIEKIEAVHSVFTTENICGLNVTIPYKQTIIPFLDELDSSASAVGAVNTVVFRNDKKIGYNTDVYGFENSLLNFFAKTQRTQRGLKALVLGTGGSSKAVAYILKKLGIEFQFVSRSQNAGAISYADLKPQIILEHHLIINTTPVGMFPQIHDAADIPYSFITSQHLLFDLIYNPEETEFLKLGKLQGAKTKNGLEMLQQQAERSWEIWNETK
ncbi:MAG: Shikimate dehydrogenase (NADP(+)) [Bacteroidia bacterium]|nr:Shikimate dehydrogenase (NADP(+)) [Bacteroidia bacterium]